MNQRSQIFLTLVILACIAVLGVVVARFRTASSGTDGDIRCLTVATTFYPLTYLAERIGGPDAHVTQLASGSVDVHDVQLSPQDIARVRESQLLLMNGQVDAWANQLRRDAEDHSIPVISMLEALGFSSPNTESGHGGEKGVEGSTVFNPHIWLDLVLVQREVSTLVDTFSRAAPTCADEFRQRGADLTRDLIALDAEFRSGLSSCRFRDVVVSHDSFYHLLKHYGLTSLPIAGFSPEEEPSPQHLADLAKRAREKGIPVVFTESLVSSKLADTLAREIHVRVLPLHSLEGLTTDDQSRGDDYFTIMRKNLAQLREGLGCTER